MVKRIFSGSLNTEQTPLQVREPPYNLNASTGFHRFHRLRTLFQNPKLVPGAPRFRKFRVRIRPLQECHVRRTRRQRWRIQSRWTQRPASSQNAFAILAARAGRRTVTA
jgi:hypothetical protein